MRTIHDQNGDHAELSEREAKQGLHVRRAAGVLGVSLALVWVILSLLWLVWSQQH